MLDHTRATQIKSLLEKGAIHSITAYAQKTYPNECCGFILEDGIVFPAQNVIDILGDKSITSKNAFLIDNHAWERVSKNTKPIICIYHSHTNGDPTMSQADRIMLRWNELCYLIIGLIDTNLTSAKLFWWEKEDLRELDITL